MIRLFLGQLVLVFIMSCSNQNTESIKNSDKGDSIAKLSKIITGEHRSEKNIQRNIYRHPVETLMFFEVEPNMKVAEISPGAGWYTEVLGPYLKDHGEYYLTGFSEKSDKPYAAPLNVKVRTMVADKNLYGKIYFSTFEAPILFEDIAPENSLDRVLTFRNIHNWMKDGDVNAAFSKFFKALKPGGILGVVEHRATTKDKQDPRAESGYVREDYVVELAKKAGFEFVAKSEINANPKDDTSHPKGVWTLPPSLRLKDTVKDQSQWLQIGESDRMTIKFRKPII